MRKLIILLFSVITLIWAIILYDPDTPLIPLSMSLMNELPPGLLEDIAHVRDHTIQDLTVSFSHGEFFYSDTVSIEILSNDPEAEIYYTMDSSTPTIDSQRYTSPIIILADETLQCTVLKAIAIDHNGTESPIFTHSYFIGHGVRERFSTHVISISTDSYHLYDDVSGILVPGKMYHDFMEENPDTQLNIWQRPSNYSMRGREWERPVYIEIITANGERVIAQNAGLRVHGGATRSNNQKGLRLVARNEYEPSIGSFHYDFFDGCFYTDIFPRKITSYDTLTLRNSGSESLLIGTPLASYIARRAGFSTASPDTGVAIFINGEYYGYADLNIQINEQFLEDLYNAPNRAFDIIDGGNDQVFTEDQDIENEFNKILEYAKKGLVDDTVHAAETFFDMDNLLSYYAFQTYIVNIDWPGNNVRIWRYKGEKDPNISESKYLKELDGRWRFILFDFDQSMAFAGIFSYDFNALSRLFDEELTPILYVLLQHQPYAEVFANYICDFAYEHFSVHHVDEMMQEVYDRRLQELKEGITFREMDWELFLEYREAAVEFADLRPHYILGELREIFGYTNMYRIVSDGSVKINSLNGKEGVYFIENSVPVTPILTKNQKFGYWLVNGEARFEDELRISINDTDSNGVVYVSHIAEEELPPLLFKDIYDTGDLSGFTMYNPTDTVQNTRGLYLSDNLYNIKKWQFPVLNISPGSNLEFVGKNSTSTDALLKIGLNFNPRYGEVIFLSNEEGVVLDYIPMEIQ